MNLWVPIEDLRLVCNLSSLTASVRDQDLLFYARTAQNAAEKFCKRSFDGLVKQTKYFSGSQERDNIQVRSFPLISITSVKDDTLRGFDSTTVVSSSDYFSIAELGRIQKKSGIFTSAEMNLQVIFYGGYISEQTIIAAALAADNMTVVSSAITALAGQPFTVWVQTATAQAAGSAVLTGLDENGTSQTETLVFTGTSASRQMSKKQWTSITDFDALAIQGAGATGTVKVTGSSFPEDLRAAIEMHVAHLYLQDQQQSVNIGSRALEQASENNYVHEIPKEVTQILNGYRDYL